LWLIDGGMNRVDAADYELLELRRVDGDRA
jgi:hypothetical protein